MAGMLHKWAFKSPLKKEVAWKIGKERMNYWEQRINKPDYDAVWERIYHKMR
jgi:hypothetical protein